MEQENHNTEYKGENAEGWMIFFCPICQWEYWMLFDEETGELKTKVISEGNPLAAHSGSTKVDFNITDVVPLKESEEDDPYLDPFKEWANGYS